MTTTILFMLTIYTHTYSHLCSLYLFFSVPIFFFSLPLPFTLAKDKTLSKAPCCRQKVQREIEREETRSIFNMYIFFGKKKTKKKT